MLLEKMMINTIAKSSMNLITADVIIAINVQLSNKDITQ